MRIRDLDRSVSLDTASAIAVQFDGQERRVELLSGEAYFTVAPLQGSETRPLLVEAANGTAKALGTQFMMERQSDGAEVTVVEHRVQVTAGQPKGDKPGGDNPNVVVLSLGQSVRYDNASGLGAITQANLDQATAWRRGRLLFDKMRLGDVDPASPVAVQRRDDRLQS